jgi:hypothetical protein
MDHKGSAIILFHNHITTGTLMISAKLHPGLLLNSPSTLSVFEADISVGGNNFKYFAGLDAALERGFVSLLAVVRGRHADNIGVRTPVKQGGQQGQNKVRPSFVHCRSRPVSRIRVRPIIYS